MSNHVIPLSTIVHLEGIADYTKDWRKDDWDKLLAVARSAPAELAGENTVAEQESENSLSSLSDHAPPQDGGHRRRIDRACEVALDNTCREYRSYAEKHYHDEHGCSGPDYAIKNIYPHNPGWSKLGFDDLAKVCSEALAFLSYEGELRFLEARITLRSDELQLQFCLHFEQFKFTLVRTRAFEFADDIGDYPTDEPEDAGC